MDMMQKTPGRKLLSRLAADTNGNVMIIFAVALPIMVGFIGLAVDYSRTQALNARLRQTADAAALAAVSTAFTSPSTTTGQATAVATNYWNTSAGSLPATPKISSVTGNGVMTTTVSYTGAQPSAFGSLFGIKTMSVAGKSVAQSEGMATQKGGMTGSGMVWGDPHVEGADGSHYIFQCPVVSGWYSMLSDAGIQVNVTCVPWGSEQVVSSVSVTVQTTSGKHNIQYMNPEQMTTPVVGQLTVDGNTFVAPMGTNTYADGQAAFTFASLNTSLPDNKLVINTPQYQLNLAYAGLSEVFSISVTGAGKCNPPGGFWGETLMGIDNPNGEDFRVPNATYTSAQFKNSTCPVVAAIPRLIK